MKKKEIWLQLVWVSYMGSNLGLLGFLCECNLWVWVVHSWCGFCAVLICVIWKWMGSFISLLKFVDKYISHVSCGYCVSFPHKGAFHWSRARDAHGSWASDGAVSFVLPFLLTLKWTHVVFCNLLPRIMWMEYVKQSIHQAIVKTCAFLHRSSCWLILCHNLSFSGGHLVWCSYCMLGGLLRKENYHFLSCIF